jgi:hypothetical protein
MPIARSTVAGAVTGVVLLAGAVGFGVGLPKVSEEPTITSADLPKLPDRLDSRMQALSTVTVEDAGVTAPADKAAVPGFAERAGKGDTLAASHLAAQYGAARVRSYIDAKAMGQAATTQTAPAQLAVSIVPGEAGLVIPNGPFEIQQSGANYQLSEIGGHRCAISWQEAVDPSTGMPATGTKVPAANYQAECRAERDGLAYDVFSSGLEPKELAKYLDLVLERTAS